MELIEMDKVLATVEQFSHMVENNEGLEMEATFWVDKDELYKFAKQEGLDINIVDREIWKTVRFDEWCDWYPLGGNYNLSISFNIKY